MSTFLFLAGDLKVCGGERKSTPEYTEYTYYIVFLIKKAFLEGIF